MTSRVGKFLKWGKFWSWGIFELGEVLVRSWGIFEVGNVLITSERNFLMEGEIGTLQSSKVFCITRSR